MKITDYIADAGNKTLFSFEVLPPLKGESLGDMIQNIEPLMEFEPSFVDVTYHREDYVLKPQSDGSFIKKSTKKRPGTVAICAALMNRFNIDAVPHLICGGFTQEETENALIELHYLGIDNVLALRGDNLKNEVRFQPEHRGNASALELITQIKAMNQGKYLDEEQVDSHSTQFCIGAAGYPEKHQDAPNKAWDLAYLKQKVDSGAEYIVTQMFFDNAKYFEFVNDCREIGIQVPIIPGLKPMATLPQLHTLPNLFHLDIPQHLATEVAKCKNNAAVKALGIEWCAEQCKDLMQAGVPILHFYTMSRSETTLAVLKQIY
jgi:methylenetetrahydrofolate reductase (NADPH)